MTEKICYNCFRKYVAKTLPETVELTIANFGMLSSFEMFTKLEMIIHQVGLIGESHILIADNQEQAIEYGCSKEQVDVMEIKMDFVYSELKELYEDVCIAAEPILEEKRNKEFLIKMLSSNSNLEKINDASFFLPKEKRIVSTLSDDAW